MKDRKLLMIPGPIEFTPAVLQAMGMPTTSHVAANFIEVFGRAIERLRQAFLFPHGQPFVVAGSGTLAMDMVAANLIEPGERALVVNTGYFGDRYASLLARYGAQVTNLRANAPGDVVPLLSVEEALQGKPHKLITITHVDTSTAVRTDVRRLAEIGNRYGALVVVDGVCSVGGEELRPEAWGIDVVLTASQKALGTPPGLAVVVASPKAMEAFQRRTRPVAAYYVDWNEWLPIMQAYEARKPSYFGTPPVNLIWALDTSLGEILAEGMDERFRRHRRLSLAFRSAMATLGLKQVPTSDALAASTLTAPYYPEGVSGSLVKHISDAGVIVAGGLLPSIKEKYFRVGHMGAVSAEDIIATVSAIEIGLRKAGHKFESGAGVAAAQRVIVG